MLEELIERWSYWAILVLAFGLNVAPILMPPTWMVLTSLYVAYPSLSPLYLSLVGTTGSTCGRFVLSYIGSAGRRFISEERKSSLDALNRYLRNRRYVYFLFSFIFALGPFPSSMLFIAYGIVNARTFGIFFGFWLGRLISYYVTITVSSVVYKSFGDLLSNQLYAIVLLDLLGLLSVIVFASIDWDKLIRARRFKFIRPRFR